jgi:hypothetical protein
VRPNFDTATEYSYKWCQELVNHLTENKITHLDLKDSLAVRSEVEKALKTHPDAMLVHYDHGDTTELIGDNGEAVVDLANMELLAGRECFNMNCLSAKVLGARAHAEHGCLAYWGYVESVIFTTDALAEFKQALNYGFFTRLEHNSWEECVSKTKKVMQQLANQLAEQGKIIAAVAMTNNMNALVCYNGGSEPPQPCPFRLLLHKMMPKKFKKYAWKLSRKSALAMMLQPAGVGFSVHDFILECQHISDPYRFPPHGFYWGTLMIVLGLLLWTWEIVNWINLKKNLCMT